MHVRDEERMRQMQQVIELSFDAKRGARLHFLNPEGKRCILRWGPKQADDSLVTTLGALPSLLEFMEATTGLKFMRPDGREHRWVREDYQG